MKAGNDFSTSVAVNGTTAVVGAYRWDNGFSSFSDEGKAYVYDLSSCGETCTETDGLLGFNPAETHKLSTTLAMSSTMIIANSTYSTPEKLDAVYVFVKKPEEIYIDGFEE